MALQLLVAAGVVGGSSAVWIRTRRGLARPLAVGLFGALILLVLTSTGWPHGVAGWLPAGLALGTAVACAVAPSVLGYLLSAALIAEGLYGFVVARTFDWNSPLVTKYMLLPVGGYSRLTYAVLPVGYALLGLGGWLLWTATAGHPEMSRRLLGAPLAAARAGTAPHRELWGLLLLPVTAISADLFASSIWFGRGLASTAWTCVIGVSAILVVRLRPGLAAGLAAAGLLGLGLLGVVTLSTGGHPGVMNGTWDEWLYGAVVIISKSTQGLALGEAVALTAAGAWLVPRTIGVQLRGYLGGAELERRVERLTKSRDIAVDSASAQLRRLERDLHDGAQARLIALGMSLSAAERLVPAGSGAALAMIAEARDNSAQALRELRGLVRGVHPPVLADRGLADAVRSLALDTAIPTYLDIDLPGRLAAPAEAACYFAVAETLTNAVKHSGAREIRIRMEHRRGVLRIEVVDDGAGGADPAGGTGLAGLEQRLAAFDGVVAVSSPPGGPTIVAMEMTCALS